MRVLVAEDDPGSSKLMSIIVKRLGFEVVCLRDGLAVERALAEEHFDLVLMDMNLPGMDGESLTRGLRAREAGGRRSVVIAVSGRVYAEDRARCFAAGVDDFLPKPLDLSLLEGRVRHWLPA